MTASSLLGVPVGALVDKPPDPSEVGQGWIGFVMFLFLAVSTVLLWLSFRRQLKKVNFEEEPDPPGTEPRTGARGARRAGPATGQTTKEGPTKP